MKLVFAASPLSTQH